VSGSREVSLRLYVQEACQGTALGATCSPHSTSQRMWAKVGGAQASGMNGLHTKRAAFECESICTGMPVTDRPVVEGEDASESWRLLRTRLQES
jgi:hypothetical protein